MIYIEVPDENDSMVSIELDDKEYFLRFTYNEKYDYWSMGIYDEDEEPIVNAVKMVSGFPLFMMYKDQRLPSGSFGVIGEADKAGRQSFVNGEAELVYIPSTEV